jgi:hypothetical protein
MWGVDNMPWCPKCKSEYIGKVSRCKDCDVGLVEEMEIDNKESWDYDSEAFLVSVSDKMEANIIESLLRESHIPVLKKYKESGAYLNIYMGASPFGIDLYVPSKKLAEAYKDGNDIINKDMKLAYYWYKKVTESGDGTSQYEIAMMLATGDSGATKDTSESMKWMEKAANNKQSDAQYLMEIASYEGIGKSKDDKQAVNWFEKSAEQSNPAAITKFGIYYMSGEWIPLA